jgi:Transcription factor S-II (TFIIS), central domain
MLNIQIFNFKNQSLRSDLINGVLTTKLLVTLTPEDLATDELRKARQSINVEDRESRRTDWLEEHKGKIQVKREALELECGLLPFRASKPSSYS